MVQARADCAVRDGKGITALGEAEAKQEHEAAHLLNEAWLVRWTLSRSMGGEVDSNQWVVLDEVRVGS